MDVSSIGSAAANAARPAPEPRPQPEPVEEKNAEPPAVARSEDKATPPPKKTLGTSLDITV